MFNSTFLNKFFDFKYTSHIRFNINQNNILDFLIGTICSNISPNLIITIKQIRNLIIIETNTNILRQLSRILPTKYINIETIDRSNIYIQKYEYIINIPNANNLIEYYTDKNITYLEHKYNANIIKDNNNIIIKSDFLIENNNESTLNIRILNNDGPVTLKSNKQFINLFEQMGELADIYAPKASYPILQYNPINSNTISGFIVKDNVLILQLNEDAFFQATEIFKQHKYDMMALEINGVIVGRCMPMDMIKQQIYIQLETKEEAEKLHSNLINSVNSFEVIKNEVNTLENNIYKLILLLILLCLIIFLIIKRKEYIKYFIILTIFLTLGYVFKFGYLLFINIILLLLLDYFILTINNIIYGYIGYVLLYSILLYIYSMSYMYNGILIHNIMYSFILLIFKIINMSNIVQR